MSSSFFGPQGLPQNGLKVAIGFVLAAAATAGASAQGAEQKDDVSLPKITVQDEAPPPSNKVDFVSSPKFTQPLLDTPQTITVVSKETLKQQGATTLSEALRNTPGVTFLLGENGNTATGDSIFLRGFDTQGSIFIDGIRDLGTISRDVFNVEQVEIAKGPSGPDNGRGAASGYVNLASKVPLANDLMDTSVSYGTADNRRITGDWNQTFNGGSAAFRLNVMGQEGGVDGRDFVKKDGWAFAPSIAFGLGSNTRTYFYLLRTEQDNRPDGGVPTIGQEGYFTRGLADNGGIAAKPDRDNFYGAKSDFDEVEATMFTARIEHDFSQDVRLRNTSRYGKSEQNYVLTGVNAITFPTPDPSTWLVDRRRQAKSQENTILTNQTNLSASFKTGGLVHALTSGVELIYEKQFLPTLAGVGTVQPANLYDPNVNDPITDLALMRNGAFSKGDTTTIGLYAFDTISLGEKWKITAGLRADDYRSQFNSIVLAVENNANNPDNLPAGTPIPSDFDTSDTLLSYKVGLLYKPLDKGTVYVSYATSQQPPGGNNLFLDSRENRIDNPNLDPQEAQNVELGTKWDLRNGALALTAAVFRSENKNDTPIDTDPANPGGVIQIGKRRVEGIELGVVGRLTDAWEISAGITKQDAQVIQGTENQTGEQISFSPDLTFNSWMSYKFPFGLTLGGGVRYVDTLSRTINKTITAMADNANLRQAPDYFVIDAMLGYQVNDKVSLQLNGYNLADEDYLASINNGGSRYIPGAPRSALLKVNVSF